MIGYKILIKQWHSGGSTNSPGANLRERSESWRAAKGRPEGCGAGMRRTIPRLKISSQSSYKYCLLRGLLEGCHSKGTEIPRRVRQNRQERFWTRA